MTDEIGYVYETDSTGEYKRTTGLIQKLEDAEITESTRLTPREKSIALLKYDPNFYIHKTVYQLFGDEVYEGMEEEEDTLCCVAAASRAEREVSRVFFFGKGMVAIQCALTGRANRGSVAAFRKTSSAVCK